MPGEIQRVFRTRELASELEVFKYQIAFMGWKRLSVVVYALEEALQVHNIGPCLDDLASCAWLSLIDC